jgi:hypothetical protein
MQSRRDVFIVADISNLIAVLATDRKCAGTKDARQSARKIAKGGGWTLTRNILQADMTTMLSSGGKRIRIISAAGGQKDVRYKTRYPVQSQCGRCVW